MAKKSTKPAAPAVDNEELEGKEPEKIVELDDEEIIDSESADVAAEALEDSLEEEFSPDMDEEDESW